MGEDVMVGIDSIIIMLIVGAIAGWLAGQIVRGFGFGLLWNIIIGIVGAFLGVWLLRQLGFNPFAGFIGSVVHAAIGAGILLGIIRFIKPELPQGPLRPPPAPLRPRRARGGPGTAIGRPQGPRA